MAYRWIYHIQLQAYSIEAVTYMSVKYIKNLIVVGMHARNDSSKIN